MINKVLGEMSDNILRWMASSQSEMAKFSKIDDNVLRNGWLISER
jgi:hypothetical protein